MATQGQKARWVRVQSPHRSPNEATDSTWYDLRLQRETQNASKGGVHRSPPGRWLETTAQLARVPRALTHGDVAGAPSDDLTHVT